MDCLVCGDPLLPDEYTRQWDGHTIHATCLRDMYRGRPRDEYEPDAIGPVRRDSTWD